MIIPEIGQFALGLALVVACLLAVLPLLGLRLKYTGLQELARSAAYVQCLLVLCSFLALEYAFLSNDFTLKYVAENSNTQLPYYYKISAVWGGHEGSLLLWALVLALWTAAVATFSAGLPRDLLARVLAVMGWVSTAFIAFILVTSNPFLHTLPDFPPDGADLNPLLQDPGLIIHPPMLYMGYVGFSVPFAFAMAGLLGGRMDSAWARWSRPWTVAAWCFLSLGIALGSWWSYYVLGWGGWWFWDPVENASFMPWLAGTALLHSLAVTEKRGVFKAWTVLLAIMTFALSVLGTFLVRSGVLTSVHAFAADPSRGLFVLGILTFMVGSALILFAWRAPLLVTESRYQLISRETFILANNVFLVIACFVVFLGTLFPLVSDVMHWGKISVGPPYFNFIFKPLALAMLAFMAAGSLARWKHQSGRQLLSLLAVPMLAAALLSVLATALAGWYNLVALGLFLLLTVAFSIVADVARKMRVAKAGLWHGFWRLSRSYRGMQLAHLGVLVSMTGVLLTTHYSVEHDLRMAVGATETVGPYQFHFQSIEQQAGPNYTTEVADIRVLKHGVEVRRMSPEKRMYSVRQMPMTKVALSPGLIRDLYVALGEASGSAWAVRIYYKPFVRWIWLGALLMAAGGVMAVSDRRYRLKQRPREFSALEGGRS